MYFFVVSARIVKILTPVLRSVKVWEIAVYLLLNTQDWKRLFAQDWSDRQVFGIAAARSLFED